MQKGTLTAASHLSHQYPTAYHHHHHHYTLPSYYSSVAAVTASVGSSTPPPASSSSSSNSPTSNHRNEQVKTKLQTEFRSFFRFSREYLVSRLFFHRIWTDAILFQFLIKKKKSKKFKFFFFFNFVGGSSTNSYK